MTFKTKQIKATTFKKKTRTHTRNISWENDVASFKGEF